MKNYREKFPRENSTDDDDDVFEMQLFLPFPFRFPLFSLFFPSFFSPTRPRSSFHYQSRFEPFTVHCKYSISQKRKTFVLVLQSQLCVIFCLQHFHSSGYFFRSFCCLKSNKMFILFHFSSGCFNLHHHTHTHTGGERPNVQRRFG